VPRPAADCSSTAKRHPRTFVVVHLKVGCQASLKDTPARALLWISASIRSAVETSVLSSGRMVRSLLLTMHGAGSYGGRDFCVVGEGPADAVGHYVNYQGNMVEMNKGKCNPLVMGGAP